MKLLLAGPGTGKTTRIKELLHDETNLDKVLILSFTNATIQDLLQSFIEENIDVTEKNCLTLHKYAARINHQKNKQVLNEVEKKILVSYSQKFDVCFDDLCKLFSCITFEQMIDQTIGFIKTNPAYLKDSIGDIRLLIVDEYQDFNPTERDLISLISDLASETIILGDDDQCIYEFKDANTDGIIDLFNNPAVEKLTHGNICYRCPDDIVEACTNLINTNKRRVRKNWIKSGKPGRLISKQLISQEDTSSFIVNEIERIKLNDPEACIMILSAVEFATFSTLKLLSEKDIKFVNLWNQKIDIDKMKRIWEIKITLGKRKVLNLLFLIHDQIKNRKSIVSGLMKIISKNPDFESIIYFLEMYSILDTELVLLFNKKASINELKSIPKYSFLTDYTEEDFEIIDLDKLARLYTEKNNFDLKGINFLSIYKSKGLQSKYVFILGLVEGIMPNSIRGLDSLEAWRRLLFVGASRAMVDLYLISTVEWDGKFAYMVDFSKFKYNYKRKKYQGLTSSFIHELNLS
jgi:DNA helicase-2/ATP-dependent DNA helicase PcrA